MAPLRDYLPQLLAISKTIGIIAPTVYAGITFAYSYVVIQTPLTHASPKLLAKQWLQAYQYGPRFVPPLILSGTLCNALLSYFSPTASARILYAFAAVAIWSIVPFTLLFMEPGINGAGKWKARSLLRDEGLVMEEVGWIPSARKHTATERIRRWAETMEMRGIVERWGETNNWRWIITIVAAVASGLGSHWVSNYWFPPVTGL